MEEMTQEEVLDSVRAERSYQDIKHRHHTHSIAEFLVFVNHYVQKAMSSLAIHSDPTASEMALECILEIAGLCVACMEQNGISER